MSIKSAFLVLALLLFSLNSNQASTAGTGGNNSPSSALNTGNICGLHVTLYEKEVDFDDLFEFTNSSGQHQNEITGSVSDGLCSDHTDGENKSVSSTSFDRAYACGKHQLPCHPETFTAPKIPFFHAFRIPVVSLSPIDHPPQI